MGRLKGGVRGSSFSTQHGSRFGYTICRMKVLSSWGGVMTVWDSLLALPGKTDFFDLC